MFQCEITATLCTVLPNKSKPNLLKSNHRLNAPVPVLWNAVTWQKQ